MNLAFPTALITGAWIVFLFGFMVGISATVPIASPRPAGARPPQEVRREREPGRRSIRVARGDDHPALAQIAVPSGINHFVGATPEELSNLFGVGNLSALRHLLLMLQRGIAVDAWGLDRYLPHVDRLDLPIHFLAGTSNHLFHPEGTEMTMQWLRDAHGRATSSRNYSVSYLNGYGHLDAIIGRDASVDVFPDILEHLEAHALP